jgi:NAD(P)-dependent dehydrogenase (short-subunit alcohol dehydrogenase family)
LATAQAFAAEGARVIITGRDQATLDKAKGTLGKDALALQNDSGAPGAAKALAGAISSLGIKLDAAFFNAGVAKLGPLDLVDEAAWDLTFNVNVKGAYFAIQALAPLMNRGAAIVLSGSVNAHVGMPGTSVYGASKAAIVSLAKTLSAELLPRGIRVNVVSPGPVDTPFVSRAGVPAEKLAEVTAGLVSQVPVKRLGTPAEIAAAVLYLASSESAYVVGTELIIDGGMIQL